MKQSEAQIQRQILDWLKIKRIFHWRNNTGAMVSTYKDKKRFMRFGAVGSPDIFALKNGCLFGIEVKGPLGQISLAQEAFKYSVEQAGGIYIEAHSLEDVTKVLEA